jgi:hypothetical protein
MRQKFPPTCARRSEPPAVFPPFIRGDQGGCSFPLPPGEGRREPYPLRHRRRTRGEGAPFPSPLEGEGRREPGCMGERGVRGSSFSGVPFNQKPETASFSPYYTKTISHRVCARRFKENFSPHNPRKPHEFRPPSRPEPRRPPTRNPHTATLILLSLLPKRL